MMMKIAEANEPRKVMNGAESGKSAVPPLSIKGLSVAYQKKPVLRDVSFDVTEGELIGVIGPNGAGKSTLMKAALGLIPTIGGEVKVYGKPYGEQRRLIGYVPQRESVDWDFPTNALDVVLMGTYGRLGWIRRPGAKEKAEAMECLRKVGMADYADRQISQLSGGQQQRVFLARALVQNAKLYFMDEPFAGVDAATEKAIITLLQELKRNGKTVIVVHHDLATVEQYFDSVLLLNVELMDFGPTRQVFTQEQLQRTYGGRLAFLDKSAKAEGAAAEPEVSRHE